MCPYVCIFYLELIWVLWDDAWLKHECNVRGRKMTSHHILTTRPPALQRDIRLAWGLQVEEHESWVFDGQLDLAQESDSLASVDQSVVVRQRHEHDWSNLHLSQTNTSAKTIKIQQTNKNKKNWTNKHNLNLFNLLAVFCFVLVQ